MMWTQKETSFLNDLKAQEQLCIEKYGQYAQSACDPELKNIFSTLQENEQQHLNTIEGMLAGQIPQQQPQQKAQPSIQPPPRGQAAHTPQWQQDAFLCQDAIATEKQVSGVYDTAVFEFRSPAARQVLNGIQAAEQCHGETIWAYMSRNGMQA